VVDIHSVNEIATWSTREDIRNHKVDSALWPGLGMMRTFPSQGNPDSMSIPTSVSRVGLVWQPMC
jgi:hypothetical protein